MKTSPTLATNRRARFDYTLHDEFIAGLVLSGQEVKSIRTGGASLRGAFVTMSNGEAWLTNAMIRPYTHAQPEGYDPTQTRKLLLTAKQLAQLTAAKQNGLTIVPLDLLARGSFIKLRIATARGKKQADKRQTIKRRQDNRDAQRATKRTLRG